MVRENDTEFNTEGLRMLYVNSSILATMEDNQLASLDNSTYPFNNLINLDPPAPTKIEIRAN